MAVFVGRDDRGEKELEPFVERAVCISVLRLLGGNL